MIDAKNRKRLRSNNNNNQKNQTQIAGNQNDLKYRIEKELLINPNEESFTSENPFQNKARQFYYSEKQGKFDYDPLKSHQAKDENNSYTHK